MGRLATLRRQSCRIRCGERSRDKLDRAPRTAGAPLSAPAIRRFSATSPIRRDLEILDRDATVGLDQDRPAATPAPTTETRRLEAGSRATAPARATDEWRQFRCAGERAPDGFDVRCRAPAAAGSFAVTARRQAADAERLAVPSPSAKRAGPSGPA